MAIGPSLPPAGPQLPSRPSAPASDSDSDDYSPSLPPDMLAARDAPRAPVGPQLPGSDALRVFESIASTSGPKPVLGPALPPRSYVAPPPPRARAPLSHAYSDDEDGPMPLPAHLAQAESNDGVRAFREREAREAEKLRGKTDDKGKLKREEWMLVPPKEGGLTACTSRLVSSRGALTRCSEGGHDQDEVSLVRGCYARREGGQVCAESVDRDADGASAATRGRAVGEAEAR